MTEEKLNELLMANITELLKANKIEDAALAVNALDDKSRVSLRAEVERLGLPELRNLYFNYETQQWID